MRRPEALNKIIEVLRRVAPNAEAILFGSEARGDAQPDSDFDILILEDVEKISYDRRTAIEAPLYDLYLSDGIDVSPIIMPRHQWKNRPFLTPFYLNVTRDGILL